MLNLNEFSDAISLNLEKRLENCKIIRAINEEHTGIVIIKDDTESPLIPLDQYYESYANGSPLEELVTDIADTFNTVIEKFGIGDIPDLTFENVKDRL